MPLGLSQLVSCPTPVLISLLWHNLGPRGWTERNECDAKIGIWILTSPFLTHDTTRRRTEISSSSGYKSGEETRVFGFCISIATPYLGHSFDYRCFTFRSRPFQVNHIVIYLLSRFSLSNMLAKLAVLLSLGTSTLAGSVSYALTERATPNIKSLLAQPQHAWCSGTQVLFPGQPNYANLTTQRWSTYESPSYIASVKPACVQDVITIVSTAPFPLPSTALCMCFASVLIFPY